ncbi:LexA family protein [Thiovibrio sp. JS02]
MKADASIAAVYGFSRGGRIVRPLFLEGVSAGFPSPADDYIDRALDLNELIIQNPPATFFVRVAGDSMLGAGIHHEDILVVDRSLPPVSGKVVIAVLNGELTVKRLLKSGERCRLIAENPAYPPLDLPEGGECEIWGVATYVIHPL